jgi:hypothetical protein
MDREIFPRCRPVTFLRPPTQTLTFCLVYSIPNTCDEDFKLPWVQFQEEVQIDLRLQNFLHQTKKILPGPIISSPPGILTYREDPIAFILFIHEHDIFTLARGKMIFLLRWRPVRLYGISEISAKGKKILFSPLWTYKSLQRIRFQKAKFLGVKLGWYDSMEFNPYFYVK